MNKVEQRIFRSPGLIEENSTEWQIMTAAAIIPFRKSRKGKYYCGCPIDNMQTNCCALFERYATKEKKVLILS